jgi:hypothetical protein
MAASTKHPMKNNIQVSIQFQLKILNASSFTVSGFYDINGQFRQGM